MYINLWIFSISSVLLCLFQNSEPPCLISPYAPAEAHILEGFTEKKSKVEKGEKIFYKI